MDVRFYRADLPHMLGCDECTERFLEEARRGNFVALYREVWAYIRFEALWRRRDRKYGIGLVESLQKLTQPIERRQLVKIEEFIETFCAEGEEDTVDRGLTLNRGPVKPEDLEKMQANVPEGTVTYEQWGFGDDVQRIWINPRVPFWAGFSALSHSLHVWRYPSRVPFLRHMDEVAEFFGAKPFKNMKEILDSLDDPNAPDDKLDVPLREVLEIEKPEIVESVLGPILDATPREFQVELMLEELSK